MSGSKFFLSRWKCCLMLVLGLLLLLFGKDKQSLHQFTQESNKRQYWKDMEAIL